MLRAVVVALVEQAGCGWAGILFSEDGRLVPGPEAGVPNPERRSRTPVVFEGATVAELVADGCPEPELLDRIAGLIPAYCLVGWDTDGVPWDADLDA